MKWRKWLSMGMAAVMVVSLSNLDMVRAAEDNKTATAFLYFTDGWYSQEVNYHKPGGGDQTKAIALEDQITGDGTYHLALDFTKTDKKKTNNCTQIKICISDGDNTFGSNSVITLQKVVINNEERELPKEGFTSFEYNWDDGGTKDTIFYLYDQNAANDITMVQEGDRVEGAQRTAKDLNLFPAFAITDIETVEVDFSFSVNENADPSESPEPSASSEPSGSPEPSASSEPSGSPEPSASIEPSGSSEPSASIEPSGSPEPSASSEPSGSPDPSASSSPSGTPKPSVSSGPSGSPEPSATTAPQVTQNPNATGGLISNSTYTGAEKIVVQNDLVIIPAGGSGIITFALLRSATSSTQVSVSSGDTGIASPVLQDDGKVRITVPGTATAGSSTNITIRFGSSSVSVKVTVRNAASKVKAAKKSYKVKRNKKIKAVFQITAQNKSKMTTDEPIVKLSGKKADVSSVKLSGSKLTVTIKGVKKGSATLKATVGGKTAKTKLKIK